MIMKTIIFLLFITLVACQSPQTKGSQSEALETEETNATISEDAVIFELAVDGMTCTGCEETVVKSVETVEGVQWVQASHTDAKVTVALNKLNPDTALVRQKITDTGYQVGTIALQGDSIE